LIISNNQNHNRKNTNFGNAGVISAGINSTMNYLATNEAIGATAVDMGAMVVPRTVVDYTRTPEAGAETLRRELVSCLFFAAMGLFGLGAAKAIMPFADAKEYAVPLDKVTAGSDAVDTMAHSWSKALDKHTVGRELTNENKDKVVDHYLNEIIGSVSGLDGEKKIAIHPDKAKEIVEDLKTLLNKGSSFEIEGKENKEFKHNIVQKIIHSAGSAENLTLAVADKPPLSIGAADLLDNTYSMARTFMSDKVASQFKSTPKVEDNKFIKDLKSFNSKKMALGLAAASVFAISMQAINRWVTKKKTGSDGFVAYKGQKAEKDKSFGFSAMKGVASAAIAAFAARSILEGKGKLKDIPKKLEFTKLMPNLAQYKFIYGVTIMGRFLASTDKNELRESVTRDFLGFTSWLILGDVAARGLARLFEKKAGVSLLNHKEKDLKTNWQVIRKSAMKTHEEILYSAGESTLGKSVAEASKVVSEQGKKALKYRNIAQLGGYVASGLLLGVGIPLLNKTVTNKLQAHKQSQKNTSSPQANQQKTVVVKK